MLEPAAREDGQSTVGVQQSHHLAAETAANQTDGALPQNRRVTADSFRALKERLMQKKPVSGFTAPPVLEAVDAIAVNLAELIGETPAPEPIFIPEIDQIDLSPVIVAEEPVIEEPLLPPDSVTEVTTDVVPEVAQEVGSEIIPEPVPELVAEPVSAQEPPRNDFWNQLPPLQPLETKQLPTVPEPEPDLPSVPEPAPKAAWFSSAPATTHPAPAIPPKSALQGVQSEMDAILSAVFGAKAETFTVPDMPSVAAQKPPVAKSWSVNVPRAPAIEPAPAIVEPEISALGADEPAPLTAEAPDEIELPAGPVVVQPESVVETIEVATAEPEAPAAVEIETVTSAEPEAKPQPVPVMPPPSDFITVEVDTTIKREPAPSLLRKRDAGAADPFAQAQVHVQAAAGHLPPVVIGEPDPQAGETARSLLDMMSASAAIAQPQERALAADTLLRLIPRIPEKMLITLADRVSIMETPPQLLVTRLIRDPRPDVAGPLLEKASHIPDRDLLTVISEGDPAKLRMIARRRHISPALVDGLLATNDPSVLLTLVRNPGAAPSHEAFQALCDQAKLHPSLQAPLVTRQDTPAPTAFELFWFVPPELRRFVLSRFLTDSENLNRILKIAMTMGDAEGKSVDLLAEQQFPERSRVENLVTLLAEGKTGEVISEMTEMAQICDATALRIISDAEGEPLTIILKVLGLSRAKFADALITLQESKIATLRKDRNPTELQSIFDSMSFNKARVLLTYWDWAAQKSGPYTQLAA